jgi:hypothetical protein
MILLARGFTIDQIMGEDKIYNKKIQPTKITGG